MKVIIAIDSFKGSLSTLEAGKAAAEGIQAVYPEAEIVISPLADGGEGTVDAILLATKGERGHSRPRPARKKYHGKLRHHPRNKNRRHRNGGGKRYYLGFRK